MWFNKLIDDIPAALGNHILFRAVITTVECCGFRTWTAYDIDLLDTRINQIIFAWTIRQREINVFCSIAAVSYQRECAAAVAMAFDPIVTDIRWHMQKDTIACFCTIATR